MHEVFQTVLEFVGDNEQIEMAQAVFNAFTKIETRLKEYGRARVIYKVRTIHAHTEVLYSSIAQFALLRLPCSKSAAQCAAYTKFKKQHGTRSTLESTVLGKRRIQYEEELSHDGCNYRRGCAT